ncbi:ninjurin-A [Lasioglossum baleicum]|uniref:ninjurin-A n=1 Tax=Lasioglossum baleicum TaxID=434251 RepID=UPI003FCC953D
METMGEKGTPEKLENMDTDKDEMDKVDKNLELDTVVEEVVINDPTMIVDTTDKKSKYKQSNTFAAKKTVAQGMMDVALITANANQLRYLLEYQKNTNTFLLILTLIIVSLSLQVAVGIGLVFKGRFDIKEKSKSNIAHRINNYVVVGVFLITIINVFIASFSISTQPSTPS